MIELQKRSANQVVAASVSLSSLAIACLGWVAFARSEYDAGAICAVVGCLLVHVVAATVPALYLSTRVTRSLTGFNDTWHMIGALQLAHAGDPWNRFISSNPPPPELEESAKAVRVALFSLLQVSRYIPENVSDQMTLPKAQMVELDEFDAYSPHMAVQLPPDWGSDAGDLPSQALQMAPQSTATHSAASPQDLSADTDAFEGPADESDDDDSSLGDYDGSDARTTISLEKRSCGSRASSHRTKRSAGSSVQSGSFVHIDSSSGIHASPMAHPKPLASMRGLATVISAKNAFLRSAKPPPCAPELVQRRVVTEVILNTKGFTDFCRQYEVDVVQKFHTRWLEACVTDTRKEGGFVERFIADELQVNFGGIIHCSSPGQKAGRYLLRVRERLDALHAHGDEELPGEHMPATYIGAAQGPAICGTLGFEGYIKGTAVLGRVIGGARALQAVARDTGFDIIVDRRIADECQGHISSVPVDVIQVGVDGTPQEVCYLIGRSGADQNEWLYGMAADLNYDRAWKVLRLGDVAQATEMMASYVQQARNHTAALVCARLQRFLAEVKRATGDPPREYCRTIRMMTFTPRPLLSRIPRASIASVVLPAPLRNGTFAVSRRRKASTNSPTNPNNLSVTDPSTFQLGLPTIPRPGAGPEASAGPPLLPTGHPSPILQSRLANFRLGVSGSDDGEADEKPEAGKDAAAPDDDSRQSVDPKAP
ncbi:hypothetical protein DIPPA_31159 [Diplonema papillatum]|nr:hypothetical protein DIPPA_31159 [Diplonema papillatum]